MNSKNDYIEKYFSEVYSQVYGITKKTTYKNILIGDLVAKYYAGKGINDQNFIDWITDENYKALAQTRINEFKYKISFWSSFYENISYLYKDIVRWLRYLFVSNNYSHDVYFFISNSKFINFFFELDNKYKEKGISTAYIFWNNKDIPENFTGNIVRVKPALPDISNKSYWTHHDFSARIDRFIKIAKNIQNKKILIPEGCLRSMHVVGRMADYFNYEVECLQWGFFGRTVTKAGWRDMPYSNFLVWGSYFKESFEYYNPKLLIEVAGHPNINNKAINTEKGAVLFAIQNKLGSHITKSDLINFLNYFVEIANENLTQQFILRTHPDLPFQKLIEDYKLNPKNIGDNVTIHNYNEYSLEQSFLNASMCVTISSTVALEAVAMGCYPVYLQLNQLPLQIHDEIKRVSPNKHVMDEEELALFIQSFNSNDLISKVEPFRHKLFSKTDLFETITESK